MLDYESFKRLLLEQRNVSYEETVKPKITKIIVESIRAAQDKLSDCNRQCFSLLGFDLLLDEECNPWLL